MPAPVFIGDELSAAAYRLGGAEVLTPAPRDLPATFEAALAGAQLVLITGEMADRLPHGVLAGARMQARPLVLVVTDAAGRLPPTDLSAWLRAQLGLEA